MTGAASRLFELSPSSAPEQIGLVRACVHFAVLSLNSLPGSPFAFFKNVMLRPREIVGTFLPTMPEDVQAMAVRVLGGRCVFWGSERLGGSAFEYGCF